MSYSRLLAPADRSMHQLARDRLIVTRRDPQTARYCAIGFLDRLRDGSGYEFAYLAEAIEDPMFLPLVGFSDVKRRYRRARLFPSFAERVIGAKRPDRPQYLASLSLDTDADSWEILSTSGGYREGDAIELISLPTFDGHTGTTVANFLAHGVRYRGPLVSDHISRLQRGQRVHLEPDPANEVNPEAVKIVDAGLHLGYVPDPLIGYVHAVLEGRPATLTVVAANPPETNPHLRLLLRLEGTIRGPFPFDEPEWRTAA